MDEKLKEQIRQMLKEELTFNVKYYQVYNGNSDGNLYDEKATVVVSINGEEISSFDV